MSGALVPTYSTTSRCLNPDGHNTHAQFILHIRSVSLLCEFGYNIESAYIFKE
jgi:hypothetical protein